MRIYSPSFEVEFNSWNRLRYSKTNIQRKILKMKWKKLKRFYQQIHYTLDIRDMYNTWCIFVHTHFENWYLRNKNGKLYLSSKKMHFNSKKTRRNILAIVERERERDFYFKWNALWHDDADDGSSQMRSNIESIVSGGHSIRSWII